jgi:DNA-binding CsgD family transcriptional regulator
MTPASPNLPDELFESVFAMKAASTLANLNQEAGRMFANLGLPKFAITRFFRSDKTPEVQVISGTFDPAWARRYIKEGYLRTSVIARELLLTQAPYSWDEVLNRRGADKDQLKQRDEARDYGLANGLFSPLRWSDGSYAAVVLAGPAPELSDPYVRTSAEIMAYFYGMGARQLLADADESPFKLSRRQRQCLQLVREGKSSRAIGDALGLSSLTVDEYVADACRRLGVRTRVQAVMAASQAGLL